MLRRIDPAGPARGHPVGDRHHGHLLLRLVEDGRKQLALVHAQPAHGHDLLRGLQAPCAEGLVAALDTGVEGGRPRQTTAPRVRTHYPRAGNKDTGKGQQMRGRLQRMTVEGRGVIESLITTQIGTQGGQSGGPPQELTPRHSTQAPTAGLQENFESTGRGGFMGEPDRVGRRRGLTHLGTLTQFCSSVQPGVLKNCRDHRVRSDLVKHLATQEPREVSQVVCKCGCWPYVREDYAVWREVFEDILLGLGVPDLPVDAFATETNHLCSVWWGPGGEHEDAFAQSWKGQFLWMNPPYSMLDKVVHKLAEDGASAILVCPIGHIAYGGDVCK